MYVIRFLFCFKTNWENRLLYLPIPMIASSIKGLTNHTQLNTFFLNLKLVKCRVDQRLISNNCDRLTQTYTLLKASISLTKACHLNFQSANETFSLLPSLSSFLLASLSKLLFFVSWSGIYDRLLTAKEKAFSFFFQLHLMIAYLKLKGSNCLLEG